MQFAFLQVILDQYHQLEDDYSFTSKLISFKGQLARLNYKFEPVFGWLVDLADMTEEVSYTESCMQWVILANCVIIIINDIIDF